MSKANVCRRSTLQRGVTLVELMVSLLIGLFLVGAVSLVYLQTAGGTRFSTLEAQMNEEGALALDLLRTQLSLAGFSSVEAATGKRVFTGLPVWGCDKGFTDTKAAFGANPCKSNGSTDNVIAVGYEANKFNSVEVTPANQAAAALPANCASQSIAAVGTNHIADNRFFIRNDSDGNPALYCRGSRGGANHSDATALVPNIESLRLRFAITRATTPGEAPPHQVTSFVDASALVTEDDWTRVAAVDVCLIVRSERPVPAGGLAMDEITRHVDCAGDVQTATDGRLRRAYRALIALPNVRPMVPRPYTVVGGTAANPYVVPEE